MKFSRVKKRASGSYYLCEYNDNSLGMLAVFLVSAITSVLSYEMFTDWLRGTQYHSITGVHGNAYGLEELNGRVFVCSSLDPETEHYKYFNTTKESMLKIIDDWVATICQDSRPNEIVITRQGEDIKFTVEE